MTVLPVPLNIHSQEPAALEHPAVPSSPAPLPVPNPTKSFWLNTPNANPLAKEGSEGPLTADADIAIIGSGITGISAAYHLARILAEKGDTSKPLKILVLEARDFCSGATGRNGGHMTAYAFQKFAAYSSRFGVDEAKRAIALEKRTVTEVVHLVRQADKEAAIDLVASGRVHLLFTEEEVVQAKLDIEAVQKAGVDTSSIEFLTKEQVKEQYGTSYPGVRIPGYNLWPLKLVTLLFDLAVEAGRSSSTSSLTLHTNTPLTAVTALPSSNVSARRWSLTTLRGAVAASYVLHATNGYASHLLPHMHGPTGIVPTRGQVIATRAAVPLQALTRSAFTGNEALEYWFPRPVEPGETNPLVILGGARELGEQPFELYVPDDSVVNPTVGAALRKFLPAVFPGRYEDGKEPEMEWTGIMGFTRTGAPFVGPVVDPQDPEAYKGQYISAGYCGHGMPRTFSCGEVVAQMIVADVVGEAWSPPEWLPRHYLTSGSSNQWRM